MFKIFFIFIFITVLISCSKPTSPEVEVVQVKKYGIYDGVYKKSSSLSFSVNIRIAKDGSIVVNDIVWPTTIDIKSPENPIRIVSENDGYIMDFLELTATSTTNENFIYKLERYELETSN